ncbi:MAG: shikimate dehydrogenase [Candidatus Thermochlorobacter sp.]
MHHAKKILGLIGYQIGYSLSPLMHNIAAEHLGLPYTYALFEIHSLESLVTALAGAKALGIVGFNITIPYKERILPYLDLLSAEASETKAVNTVLNQDGQLIGYNTDIYGFAEPLLPFKSYVDGNDVAVFGAGGAARAVVQALRQYFKPSCIHIIARDEFKANALKDHFKRRSKSLNIAAHLFDAENLESVLASAHLIINATPLGTDSPRTPLHSAMPFPAEWKIWSPHKIAYDLVYRPKLTPFLRTAQESGATIIPGFEMLIAQGAKSFEIWTGKEMPREIVRGALLEALAQLSI